MSRFLAAATLALFSLLTPAFAEAPGVPDETAPDADEAPELAPRPSPLPPPPGAEAAPRPQAKDAKPADAKPSDAKSKVVDIEAEKRRAVDELLGRLAKTDDPPAAKRIAAAVQALWQRSGSDTIDLLTARATEAQRAQKPDMAIKLLDEVVSLKPDFADGWSRRAAIRFQSKDYDDAMADLHQTLVREPRQFVAWLGLARILVDAGLEKQALAAFRKVLEIYPAIEGVKKEADDLALKVEGQPI